MIDKEKFLESGLLEQYALGLTDEEESRVVEEFCEKYPEIKAELYKLQKGLHQYASENSVPPPARKRARVNRVRSLVTALSMVGFVSALIFAFFQTQEKEKYQVQVTRLEAELETCKHHWSDKIRQAEFMQHQDTKKVLLAGLNDAQGNVCIAFWNEKVKKACVDLGSLPPPPPGMAYQIWADVNGKMINAGLLQNISAGHFQDIAFVDRAESLNITIEPAGGSQHPTVEKLLANGRLLN